MNSKSILPYIHLGTVIRYLQDASVGWLIHGDAMVLANMKSLFNYISTNEWQVTMNAAYKMKEIMVELENTEADSELTHEQAKRISACASALRDTLEAESQMTMAFFINERRYRSEHLLNNVSKLFDEGVYEALPQIARYDFTYAGRCLAFNLPTATGFHLMRGTEATLKWFYRETVKRNRVKNQMWGPMIQSLRNRKSAPPIELLDNLDNIRRNYRNPTQHPDKMYSITEAQDLLGLCIDVVNKMVNEIVD